MEHTICLNNVELVNENGNVVKVCNINIIYSTKEQKQRALYIFNRKQKIEYQKNYVEENHDKYINYQKDYYNRRKEEILSQKKEKIMCECGRTLTSGNMTSHLKTKLHKKHLALKMDSLTSNKINKENETTQTSRSI
jgi:hypothetical protein